MLKRLSRPPPRSAKCRRRGAPPNGQDNNPADQQVIFVNAVFFCERVDNMTSPTPPPESAPKSASDKDQPDHNGRRMLLDFGPLLLFFAVNYFYNDLMLSVKVLVVATLVSLALSWHSERRVSMMAAVGCAALVFFAGLTLYFDNELFIKIKPTVVTLLFAAIIAGGRLLGRNPLAAIIGKQISLTPQGWRAISWLWVAMFATSAAANEVAWRVLSTNDWITFKVFGLTGISFLFFMLSVPILQKHQREN